MQTWTNPNNEYFKLCEADMLLLFSLITPIVCNVSKKKLFQKKYFEKNIIF